MTLWLKKSLSARFFFAGGGAVRAKRRMVLSARVDCVVERGGRLLSCVLPEVLGFREVDEKHCCSLLLEQSDEYWLLHWQYFMLRRKQKRCGSIRLEV